VRKAISIAIGVVLVLLGTLFASQGAGIVGGSSLMDNNPEFIYVGALVAVVGIALVLFAAVSKAKA
jgi:hypothetical protein